MKISLSKNMTEERKKYRRELDNIFMPRIDAVMYGKGALYTLKAAEARRVLGGASSNLINSEQEATIVIYKNDEMQSAIAKLEELRQQYQQQIDNANTVPELEKILNSIKFE